MTINATADHFDAIEVVFNVGFGTPLQCLILNAKRSLMPLYMCVLVWLMTRNAQTFKVWTIPPNGSSFIPLVLELEYNQYTFISHVIHL